MQIQNASTEPTPSTPQFDLGALQDALNQAEAAVQACGPRLQLQITSGGDVELVRRTEEATAEPPLARLAGCDPLLWRTDASAPGIDAWHAPGSAGIVAGAAVGTGAARGGVSGMGGRGAGWTVQRRESGIAGGVDRAWVASIANGRLEPWRSLIGGAESVAHFESTKCQAAPATS